jgi:ABC-type branched-subunit amino acid transport system substrate-binding protein
MIAATDRRFFAASRMVILVALALLLAGCGGMSKLGGLFSDSGSAPPAGTLPPLQGGTKVALLLPLSAVGDQAQVAIAMKQAAEMALIDAGGQSGISLITKDTNGTAAGATAAAQDALAEGAEIILGPLLGAEVQAIKPVAAAQSIPIIAFSSSSGVAGNGVYLLSFLPEEEASTIVRYLAKSGKNTIAALLPKSQYGLAIERAIVPAGQKHGVSVAVIERFPRNNLSIVEPVNRIARVVNDPARKVDALLIAEGGDLLKTLGAALKNAGVDQRRTLIVGTGLWDNPVTPETAIAVGGLYAGVAPDLVQRFDDKYKASFSTRPSRLASLAYDAVSLANTLAREPQGQRFSQSNITNPEGFQGMNGLFRFRQNGLVERGLTILRVTTSGVEVQDPAPSRFSAAGAPTSSAQQAAN